MIGSLLAVPLTGLFADKYFLHCARRRGGISEAEDRLHLMIPSAIVLAGGIWIYGFS